MELTTKDLLRIATGFESTATQMTAIQTEFRGFREAFVRSDKENAIKDTAQEGKITNLQENMDTILTIVRDGNGHDSVLSRLDGLERSQEGIRATIDSVKETLSNAGKVRSKISLEEVKGRWVFRKEVLVTALAMFVFISGTIWNNMSKLTKEDVVQMMAVNNKAEKSDK